MNANATKTPARSVTFRDVFAVGEFRSLWIAQLLSIGGDQFARVALAVLVYDRTGSAALAAVTFAVTAAAMLIGGLALGWTADRFPRRALMITCDIVCTTLILVMTVPGLPVAALVVLLFTATLLVEPFISARSAINRAVLGPERFGLGTGITHATYQVAQLIGAAAGGVVVATAGVRAALLIDAATFAASAVIIRLGVKARPAASSHAGPARPRIWAGFRLVFSSPLARTAMLLMWLAAFLTAPEGVVAPLSRQLGGGAEGVGWLLAAMAAGGTVGPLAYARLIRPARRRQLAAVTALAACAVLTAFAFSPPMAGALVILFASGVLSGYIAETTPALYGAVPDARRGLAGGVVGAGLGLGQGLGIIVAGVVAQRFGAEAAVAGAGAAGTVTAASLAVSWRKAHRAGP